MTTRGALEVMSQFPTAARLVGPRDEDLVRAAEDALGVTFSPTFRRFVSELGAGGFGAAEFYGVTSSQCQNSSVPNGIWVTLYSRERFRLPRHVIALQFDEESNILATDTSRSSPVNEHPVALWCAGLEPEPEEVRAVAGDFGEFLPDRAAEESEDLHRRGTSR